MATYIVRVTREQWADIIVDAESADAAWESVADMTGAALLDLADAAGWGAGDTDVLAADLAQGETDPDDDPICACGVHRSEHALCGCEQFQTAASWQAEQDRFAREWEEER